MRRVCGVALLLLALVATAEACGGRQSPLFGCTGERWDRSRMPLDWSYAGFAAGERGIPVKPVSVDVRRLGAKGDGKTDDSWAIEKAVAEARPGTAIYFPPGRYVLTRRLDIRKSIVLRGAGKTASTLFFPKPLAEVYGNRGGWGHGTCWINFWGHNPVNHASRLAAIKGGAARGSDSLLVDATAGVQPGAWVRVALADSTEVFKATLLGNSMEPGWPGSGSRNVVRFSSRVKAVNPSSGRVTLERPLPWEIKPSFGATLHRVMPTLTEVGVESLAFEMAWTPYPGHLREDGWNALHFNQLAHSWVRDVSFLNTDAAFYSWGSSFCSISGVDIDVTRSRATAARDDWGGRDRHGHRGIWLEFGEANLVTNARLKVPLFHDFTVATGEFNSVFAASSGADMNLDFHRGLPHSNLFTDLDLGAGTRGFRSGGGVPGPNTAGFQTFWNLRAGQPLAIPNPQAFGPLPLLNFEGVQLRDAASARADPRQLEPRNLWQAMRRRRLGQ